MRCFKNVICIHTLVLCALIQMPEIEANDKPLPDISFADFDNLAIGAFNVKKNRYLFALPKDHIPSDRGIVWGTLDMIGTEGNSFPSISIFECGLLTSHLGPFVIDFSDNDEYLVVVSGGEGGSVIDVFNVKDLFGPVTRAWWNGTEKCVTPLVSVGDHNVEVDFVGWIDQVPLIESPVPLDQVTTAKEVFEYEKAGLCCAGKSKIYTWDVSGDQFSQVKKSK